jgi:site-specific recombinase XerD
MSRTRLDVLARVFLDELRARQRSRSSLQQCRYALALLGAYLRRRRVRDVRAVGEEHIVSFARWLSEREGRAGRLSPSARASYLSAVRSFFAYLERRGLLLRSPARDVPLPKSARLPRAVLSRSRARQLLEAPMRDDAVGLRGRAILELLYGTGLRLSECERLDVQDVDLQQGVLLVRNGKGRKDRYVPLSGEAARALDRYLRCGRGELLRAPLDALFVSRFGQRLGQTSIGLMVRQRARRLGFGATPHALRHACATHMLRGGAGVRAVQEILGHKSLETTARYTQVAQRDLRRALARAHPRRER